MTTRRKVVFSDLTGELIEDPADAVRVTVIEHPELLHDYSVVLDAAISELGDLANIRAAVLELRFANKKKMRVTIATEDFDALATKKPMAELLRDAYYLAEID